MLQRNSPVPLYIQIKQLLKKHIESGKYPVGARLPSERELAEVYNISRMTVRQALQALTKEGLIQSRVGTGTFVRRPTLDQELWTLTSFSEEMRQRGLTPNSRVQRTEIIPATRAQAEKLGISSGDDVVIIDRVRLANDCPIAIEVCHLPYAKCPGILENNDFSHESLYDILRHDYGIMMVWADQTIQAGLSDETEGEALQLDQALPVLRLARVTFDEHNHPLEYVESVYRGDEYQLRAILWAAHNFPSK